MQKKRRPLLTTLLLVLGAGLFLGTIQAQSLAELARKERARKGQPDPGAKVYTNDDVSTSAPAPAPAPAAEAGEAAAEEPTPERAERAEAAAEPEAEAAAPEEKSRAELEKEYRAKFARLREEQAYEERKLDVMQRELNLLNIQFYSDPNVAMREQHTRAEINQRTQEIEEQKGVVEQKKAAIAALEEELRRNRLPPGWAR